MANFLGPVKLRVDTTANWQSYAPVLRSGEIGVDADLKRIKIGDGTNGWLQLPWMSADQETIDAILAVPGQVADTVIDVETAQAAAETATTKAAEAVAAVASIPEHLDTEDGAIAALVSSTTSDTRGVLNEIIGAKSILEFGAVGDGETNDFPAFEAAALDPAPIFLPWKRFKWADGSQLTIPQSMNGKVFFSYAPYGVDPADEDRPGAVIITNTVGNDVSGDPGAAAMVFECSMGRVYGIAFQHAGTSRETGAAAIRADREHTGDSADDIDVTVEQCAFSGYEVGLRVNGRGIRFNDNRVIDCATAVRASFPTSGTDGLPIQSDVLYGWRANEFCGNRGHSIGILVETTGAGKMKGALIAHNDLDIGDIIFKGAIQHSTISDNICRFKSGSNGAITITAGGDYTAIVDNILNGGDTGADVATLLVGTYGIEVQSDSGTTVIGLIIDGNIIEGFSSSGIIINPPLEFSEISSIVSRCGQNGLMLVSSTTGCTIGGVYRDIGVTASATHRGCIRLSGSGVTHTRLSILGAQLKPNADNAYAHHVMVSSATLTSVKMHGCQFHKSGEAVLYGTYTDGGGNVLETA